MFSDKQLFHSLQNVLSTWSKQYAEARYPQIQKGINMASLSQRTL